jgi:hypothetical protein
VPYRPLAWHFAHQSQEKIHFSVKDSVARRYPAVVTVSLIALNALEFLYQLSLPPLSLERFLRLRPPPDALFRPGHRGLPAAGCLR